MAGSRNTTALSPMRDPGKEKWVCYCGLRCKVSMSWTDMNPGRRFLGCAKFQASESKCSFFAWLDPPICPRGRVVISGLLRSMSWKDNEIGVLKSDKEVSGVSNTSPPKNRPKTKTYKSQNLGCRWSVRIAPNAVREKVKTKTVPLPYGEELVVGESSSKGEDSPTPKRTKVNKPVPVRMISLKYFNFDEDPDKPVA